MCVKSTNFVLLYFVQNSIGSTKTFIHVQLHTNHFYPELFCHGFFQNVDCVELSFRPFLSHVHEEAKADRTGDRNGGRNTC